MFVRLQAFRSITGIGHPNLLSDTHSHGLLAHGHNAGLHLLPNEKSKNHHQQGKPYVYSESRLNPEYNFFQYVNAAMWILSISIIVSVLVGLLPFQNTENPAGQVAHSLWFALYRNSWGFAISWIILACQTGTGGILKWFLELPVWQPLGRMSLSFYLVHSVYQTVFIGSGKVPLHFNMRSLVKFILKRSFDGFI